MLVNSKEILRKATKDGYAVPAYNINNLEWTRYILEACEEDKSPVIISATPSAIKYMGGYNVVCNLIKNLMKDLKISIPVAIHLDHGKSFDDCKNAIDAGFTSVMIDASSFPLERNIEETNKVIKYINGRNIGVEAEIGSLNEEETQNNDLPQYASEEDAKTFVFQTGVDFLAPAIGNKHGIYNGEPKLDFDLLGSICRAVKIPLVLHGASGLDENKIKTAIFCGISKININTDIQIAWTNAVRQYLSENESVYDPRKIIASGKHAIKNVVHKKNKLFDSIKRAN